MRQHKLQMLVESILERRGGELATRKLPRGRGWTRDTQLCSMRLERDIRMTVSAVNGRHEAARFELLLLGRDTARGDR